MFRSFCCAVITVSTLIALCYFSFYTYHAHDDLSGFAYSPGGSYLLSLSPLSIMLYDSITLEVKHTTTVTKLFLVDSRPPLKHDTTKIVHKRTYDIHYENYLHWYYYLYPGSNFSVNICVDKSSPMEAFMLRGIDTLNKWLDNDMKLEYDQYHQRVEQCPNVTNMSSITYLEDLYRILVYNNDYCEKESAVLSIEYIFERQKFSSDGLIPDCQVTTGHPCTTDIPFDFKYKYILITISIPSSVDWTENVELKVAYHFRMMAICLMLIMICIQVTSLFFICKVLLPYWCP